MSDETNKKYTPMEYPVDIVVPGTVGSTAKGSVPLNNRPFVLHRIKHLIIVRSYDPALPGATPPGPGIPAWLNTFLNQQHGMYRIDWSIHETARFWKGQPPMADTFGSIRHGIFDPLDAPLVIDGNETLNVQITNEFIMPIIVTVPPGTIPMSYTVQVKFCGIERIV